MAIIAFTYLFPIATTGSKLRRPHVRAVRTTCV